MIVSKGTTKSLKLGTAVGVAMFVEIKGVGLVIVATNELVAVAAGLLFAGESVILPRLANGSFDWLDPIMSGAVRFPRLPKGSFDWLDTAVGGAVRFPRLLNGTLDWLNAVVGGADKFPRILKGSLD